jgi:hypothetical protein
MLERVSIKGARFLPIPGPEPEVAKRAITVPCDDRPAAGR